MKRIMILLVVVLLIGFRAVAVDPNYSDLSKVTKGALWSKHPEAEKIYKGEVPSGIEWIQVLSEPYFVKFIAGENNTRDINYIIVPTGEKIYKNKNETIPRLSYCANGIADFQPVEKLVIQKEIDTIKIYTNTVNNVIVHDTVFEYIYEEDQSYEQPEPRVIVVESRVDELAPMYYERRTDFSVFVSLRFCPPPMNYGGGYYGGNVVNNNYYDNSYTDNSYRDNSIRDSYNREENNNYQPRPRPKPDTGGPVGVPGHDGSPAGTPGHDGEPNGSGGGFSADEGGPAGVGGDGGPTGAGGFAARSDSRNGITESTARMQTKSASMQSNPSVRRSTSSNGSRQGSGVNTKSTTSSRSGVNTARTNTGNQNRSVVRNSTTKSANIGSSNRSTSNNFRSSNNARPMSNTAMRSTPQNFRSSGGGGNFRSNGGSASRSYGGGGSRSGGSSGRR